MNLMLALVLTLQTTVDPLLSRLVGQWSGTGTVLNQPSKIEMSWSAVLGGQFVRLTFRNEMPKSLFEGHGITARWATLRLRSGQSAVIAVCGLTTRA